MGTILAFGSFGTPEIIAILVVVFLLFGAKKLPELARGIGKSLGEFKKAKNEFENEIMNAETKPQPKKPEEIASVPNPYPEASIPQPVQPQDEAKDSQVQK